MKSKEAGLNHISMKTRDVIHDVGGYVATHVKTASTVVSAQIESAMNEKGDEKEKDTM